jgi:mRNA interferase RelE/StbE
MASYEIVLKASVAKDLRRIPNKDVRPILDNIESLAQNPRPIGCAKLSALERYRVREGVYRIVYEISDTELIVHVVKVAHRREIYQGI